MTTKTDPNLSSDERRSTAWLKVRAHLIARLESARKELEGPLDQDNTNKVRGRIAELKKLLALGEDEDWQK